MKIQSILNDEVEYFIVRSEFEGLQTLRFYKGFTGEEPVEIFMEEYVEGSELVLLNYLSE